MIISDRSRSDTQEAANTRVLGPDPRGNSRQAEPTELGTPEPSEISETVIDDGLPAPDYVDTNNRLVDELERILHGDFADRTAVPEGDGLLAGDFPLASDGFEEELDEENASFAPAYGDPTDEPIPLEEGNEPLQEARAGFWEPDEPTVDEPRRSDEPIDRMPVGRFTIATILLMVVAGGTYAYVQLTGDPVLQLNGEAEIAAASPLGGAAAEAETVAAAPDPGALVIDANGEGVATEMEDGPIAGIEAAVETVQPRLVRTVAIPAPTAEAANANAANPTPEANEVAGLGGPLVEPEAAEPEPAELFANLTPEIVADPTPAEPPAAEAGFDPADATPPTTVTSPTTVATTNDWVNLRAGPDNDSAVIQTVPFGAELQLVGCDPWCEVYYEGTHGWIWRDFINTAP